MEDVDVKPQPTRLYGRQISRPLRLRQKYLLDDILPTLRLTSAECSRIGTVFPADITSIILEIGFGSGEHTYQKLLSSQQTGFIACEVFINGLCSFLSKLCPPDEEEHFKPPRNLKIWDDDGRTLLAKLPPSCLDQVFLLFPDPWPKKKHAKRRFVHPQNVRELARVIKQDGLWYIASDDPVYQEWVATVMDSQPWFDQILLQKHRPEGCFETRYEMKAKKASRQPLYWIFKRNAKPLQKKVSQNTELT